jgi:Spy/CpxP family protein refolding chaperone
MIRRIAIAAAVALSLATLPLVAQEPPGAPGGGFGPGGQRPGGPGRGGPGGPMGLLPGLNRVDLTDAQREQVRAVMEQERQANGPGEKLRQAEQALNAAVLSSDGQGIETAKAALSAAQASELDHRVEIMQKIVQILTPEQRQALAQLPPPGGRGRGRGAPGHKPYI